MNITQFYIYSADCIGRTMTGQFNRTVHAPTDHRRIIGSVHRKHRKTQYMVGSQADRTTGPNFRSTTDLASFFLDVPASV